MRAMVKEGCISCGLCVDTCPEVFQFNDEGLSEVYAPISKSNEGTVRETAENCPVDVIVIEQ